MSGYNKNTKYIIGCCFPEFQADVNGCPVSPKALIVQGKYLFYTCIIGSGFVCSAIIPVLFLLMRILN